MRYKIKCTLKEVYKPRKATERRYKGTVPPADTMGAQNTKGIPTITTLLDWCAFVVPRTTDIYDLLGLDAKEFEQGLRGHYGYQTMAIKGHVKIFTNPHSDDMGTYVEMSGQGCREYEAYQDGKKWMWDILFSRILSIGGHFTRIDIAIDEYGKHLNFKTIVNNVKKGQTRSLFKSTRIIENLKIADGSSLGKTVYFGSTTSRMSCRIYDKREEQISKGIDVGEIPQHWIRVELQMRKERATEFINEFIQQKGCSIHYLVNGVIRKYITFCEKNPNDSNKARWKTCKWWDKFLFYAEKISLTTKPEKKTIEDLERWLIKQIAPSMAMLCMNKQGELINLPKIVDIVLQNLHRVSKKKLNSLYDVA